MRSLLVPALVGMLALPVLARAASTHGDVAHADAHPSVARAQALQRHMNDGRNYADAWAAAAGVSPESTALAEQHQRAMNAGKDHADARAMPMGDVEAVMRNAQRHEAAMNRGLDHEDARAGG